MQRLGVDQLGNLRYYIANFRHGFPFPAFRKLSDDLLYDRVAENQRGRKRVGSRRSLLRSDRRPQITSLEEILELQEKLTVRFVRIASQKPFQFQPASIANSFWTSSVHSASHDPSFPTLSQIISFTSDILSSTTS